MPSVKSASQPTPPKSNFDEEEIVVTPKATPTKRRPSNASVVNDTNMESATKKTKTGPGKSGDNDTARFAEASSDDDSEDEESCYSFEGKKLKPLKERVFKVGNVVAFLAHEGNSLGRRVNELEKWLGKKSIVGDTYSTQPNWVNWVVGDKTAKFGSVKLPAYVPLAEDCQAIVVIVKHGWIPDLNVEWLRSWVFEFNCDFEERSEMEIFLKRADCFKATKGLKAYMSLIEDKANGSLNKWELRLIGATEGRLLAMRHGSEAKFSIEVGQSTLEATVTAHSGCSVCWDGDSTPGNRHVAAKCHFLQKANVERKKAGLDPILIVDATAVSTVEERAKLPLDKRITQLESENKSLRGEVRTLANRLDNLEKNKGTNGGQGGYGGSKGSGGPGGYKPARRKVAFKQDQTSSN